MMAGTKKQYGGWVNPPPVVVLSGNEWFYRRRELQKACVAARVSNRVVVRLDGDAEGAVSDAINEAMFGGPVLAIVSSPEKADLEVLAKHAEGGDATAAFVLHYEGVIKANSGLGKLAATLPKQHNIVFNKPEKAYKHPEYAAEFTIAEGRRHGIQIPDTIADGLVAKIGTDLGVLAFEVLKVATYMAARKEGPEVTRDHIRATLTIIGEANLSPLTEALALRSARSVLREMDRLNRELPEDSPSSRTLSVCGWVGGTVTRWLHACVLDEAGASESEASSRMSVPPYVYSRFLLPPARRWGAELLQQLMRSIAVAEASAKSGRIDAWVGLESSLVLACRATKIAG